MSDSSTKIAERTVGGADPVIEALLEELRQAQAEMERLQERVTKLLGKPKYSHGSEAEIGSK